MNDQTFVNPNATPETYEVKSARPSMVELKQDGIEESPASKQELSFRSKKARPGERLSKGDGSILLVSPNSLRTRDDAKSKMLTCLL